MKIGVVYTSTTPELIEEVEKQILLQLGENTAIDSFSDASVLNDVIEAGGVTPAAAAKLTALYLKAIQKGADAIFNVCSSVGEVADSLQNFSEYIGIPLVRIDEKMCHLAVKSGSKIAVMATLPTTLNPTKNTLKRMAREQNKHIELIDILVENAFGIEPDQFKQKMCEAALKYAKDADVILLAQGSMCYCEEELKAATQKTVLSSPRIGVTALKDKLELL